MPTNLQELENRLWQAADNLRANSSLSSFEYSNPVLGLIFLRYAWHRFKPLHEKLEGQSIGRRTIGPADYKAEGVMYLPEEARYDYLLQLPESEDIGQKVNEAMEAIERENPELADVLPKQYKRFGNPVLKDLLKNFSNVGTDVEGDVFGQIYEYFLGKFAMSEGQKGGEFFTPTSIVKLIVEVLEPYGGKILDPACGSGGMFVQSEKFRQRHRVRTRHGVSPQALSQQDILSIYGQENKEHTVRLCKMNLAVHGLEGDIKAGNTYYENLHDCVGRFDYVMANPPFNVSGVDKEAIEGDRRYPFGIPSTDNANYLWIQEFYSALNENGRAGFVMANSAADARHSEQEIRKKLIEEGVVDVIISISSNFFYTVTLPCTLWFLDKGKKQLPKIDIEDVRSRLIATPPAENKENGDAKNISSRGRNTVLFIDARNIYRQIDRAHRDFTDAQLDFIANIVRLYRGEELDSVGTRLIASPQSPQDGNEEIAKAAEEGIEYKSNGSNITQPENMHDLFPAGQYRDIPGLCKVATIEEIKEQGWSLNPGRYVGVAEREEDDVDFKVRLGELYEELQKLNNEATRLQEAISNNVSKLI